jgi:hypothetical protein
MSNKMKKEHGRKLRRRILYCGILLQSSIYYKSYEAFKKRRAAKKSAQETRRTNYNIRAHSRDM